MDETEIDLYLSLADQPRPLTSEEAAMMVELVDAWRHHEHRKHMALMEALNELHRRTTDTNAPPTNS